MAMTTSKKLEIGLLVLVVLVVIVGGVYALTRSDPEKDDNTSGTNTAVTAENQEPALANGASDDDLVKAAAVITYSDDGFSPAQTTVKSGDILAIKNTSTGDLEFESGPHPAHTSNPELNVGTVLPGQSKVFTVSTKGEFSVHNHNNPGQTARIAVE